MTKDKAIEILSMWLSNGKQGLSKDGTSLGYIEGWFHQSDVKAFEMGIEALSIEPCEDMGEVSDGYHTFNQLYHQRAMLFAALVNLNKNISWKSLKHEDGKYCFDKNGDWFIVGIDTPEGTYTYHYETDKYWNIFDCQVLPIGKHWDGHTEKDVTRLLSLQQESKTGVLDKIRAEIKNHWYLKKCPSSPISWGLREAIEIIDKYTAESEDKECGK